MQSTIRINLSRACSALLLLSVPALLSACCASAPEGASDTSVTAAMRESVSELNVPNASLPTEGVLAAGQLSPEQMAALQELGYTTFISLRVATENGAGWEEAYATKNGVNFIRLPIAGGAGVNEAAARELAEVMEASEGPTVLYCGSSNRVGALLALKGYYVESMPAEEALVLGRSAGMTRLEPKVRTEMGLE